MTVQLKTSGIIFYFLNKCIRYFNDLFSGLFECMSSEPRLSSSAPMKVSMQISKLLMLKSTPHLHYTP